MVILLPFLLKKKLKKGKVFDRRSLCIFFFLIFFFPKIKFPKLNVEHPRTTASATAPTPLHHVLISNDKNNQVHRGKSGTQCSTEVKAGGFHSAESGGGGYRERVCVLRGRVGAASSAALFVYAMKCGVAASGVWSRLPTLSRRF